MNKAFYLCLISLLVSVGVTCLVACGKNKPVSSSSGEKTEFSSSTKETSASSSRAASKVLNLEELVAGDYSSVAGTWRNADGQELIFDEQGLVSDSYEGYGLSATDYGTAAGGIYGGEDGGFLIEFIPAGLTLENQENFTDNSDNKQDRIWTGHGISSFEEQGEFYYRVK